MYSGILKNIFRSEYFTKISQTFQKGAYTIVNSCLANIKVDSKEFMSQMELSTDFQAHTLNVSVWDTMVTGDVDGYNRKVLTESGGFSFSQAYEEFTKYGTAVKISQNKKMVLQSSLSDHDSQESFLLNMLISWFKSTILVDEEDSSALLTIKPFKDSHVVLPTHSGEGEVELVMELGLPAPNRAVGATFWQRSDLNYWDRPYVVKYNALSSEQQAFYLAHTLGRETGATLNLDIDIDTLPIHACLFEPLGRDVPEGVPDYSTIPWSASELLYSWILDYVELNRCYKAFAAALDVLGALAYHPNPSYHESIFWNKSVITLHLAPFTPTRARVPSTLDGEPSAEDTLYVELFRSEAKDPINFLFNASILNYVVWMGLYGLLENSAHDYQDWTVALNSINSDTQLIRGITSRAEILSIMLGVEVPVLFTNNCYVDFDLSYMKDYLTIPFIEVMDPHYPKQVTITRPVPYVSGSLLLGAFTSDITGFDHLKPRQNVTVGEDCVLRRDEALKLGNMYRLFGHQLHVREKMSYKPAYFWANFRELVVPYYDLANKYSSDTQFEVTGSVARAGRADTILGAGFLRPGDNIEMCITRPHLKLTNYGTRVERVSIAQRSHGKKVILESKIRHISKVVTKKMKVREKVTHMPHFREDLLGITPMDPPLGTLAVPVQSSGPLEPDRANAEDAG